ncbi:MAG: hypothetical protein HKP48_06625 [Winogradskyella sp.]|uniref:hypothetical protein n=1 Tax=Winogradskyella sp. TaxID=1883156 RepID=UPI00180D787B|nr:hypothetical protein [Winogradskyella sp.]MBT8243637.1 hypothetical protein [Winogradskyella sp.]NNK22962.1 hypothetical protein [Winogradskyella sp.]
MKKKLESELVSIAHRILKLTGKEDINRMHEEVAILYEKLTVLKFAQENFEEELPKIGNDSSFFGMLDAAFNNTISDNIEVENKVYVNMDEREDDGIMEPVMNKIKDMVAFMPQDGDEADDEVEDVTKGSSNGQQARVVEFETITQDFANIPEFEPIEDAKKRETETKVKSLNDKLKSGGLQIGLNDKIAFIKHLFGGKSQDYDRVISQINTATSLQEAQDFIEQLVKPDYNNWEGKEEYEERLLEIVEGKFN